MRASSVKCHSVFPIEFQSSTNYTRQDLRLNTSPQWVLRWTRLCIVQNLKHTCLIILLCFLSVSLHRKLSEIPSANTRCSFFRTWVMSSIYLRSGARDKVLKLEILAQGALSNRGQFCAAIIYLVNICKERQALSAFAVFASNSSWIIGKEMADSIQSNLCH